MRKRPLSTAESKQLDIVHVHRNCVHVFEPKTGLGSNQVEKLNRVPFPFDVAFSHEHTNKQIFECLGRPLVERAFGGWAVATLGGGGGAAAAAGPLGGGAGGSGTLFAYGQTGAGKTFSVSGSAGFLLSKGAAGDGGRAGGGHGGDGHGGGGENKTETDKIPGLVQLTAEALLTDPRMRGKCVGFLGLA